MAFGIFFAGGQGVSFSRSGIFPIFTTMRRLMAYLSVFFTVLLLSAGVVHFSAERGYACVSGVPEGTLRAEVAGGGSSDLALQDSYTWYVVPSTDPVSLSGRTAGGANSGVRCSWLTGLRREVSGPGFPAADIFLSYLGRESSARSFASWRASLCGASCGGAISVSRPGDGFIYALRRIVV